MGRPDRRRTGDAGRRQPHRQTARRGLPVGHRDQRIAGAPIGSRLGDGLAEGGRARGATTGRDGGEVRPLLRAGGAQDCRQGGPLPDQPGIQRHGARRQDPRLVHSSVQGQPTVAADRPAAQALRDPLTVSSSSMVHPGRAVADVGEAVRTAVGEVRSSLTDAFGVALLSAEPVVDPARRIVRLEGTVASAHVADRVVEATLARATGWSVDARRLTPFGTDRWRRLPPGVTAVWSSPGDRGRTPTLTSQLLPNDGPVEVLHRAGQGTLVRTAHGTLGWVRGPLGSMAPPPVGSRPRARAPLATVVTAWLGVPYRLRGAPP